MKMNKARMVVLVGGGLVASLPLGLWLWRAREPTLADFCLNLGIEIIGALLSVLAIEYWLERMLERQRHERNAAVIQNIQTILSRLRAKLEDGLQLMGIAAEQIEQSSTGPDLRRLLNYQLLNQPIQRQQLIDGRVESADCPRPLVFCQEAEAQFAIVQDVLPLLHYDIPTKR